MFIKSELTKDQLLKRKEKTLPGKDVKSKFKACMSECIETLKNIQSLKSHLADEVLSNLSKAIQYLESTNITTSDRLKLFELMVCLQDTNELWDDMKHHVQPSTYAERLKNILDFTQNFSTQSYQSRRIFYQDKKSSLEDQIEAILKVTRYKSAKLEYQLSKTVDEIRYLESSAKEKAQNIANMSKQSFDYQDQSQQIMLLDQKIRMHQGNLNLARKTKKSFDFLNQIFEQLTLLEAYTKSLKQNGPTVKLIKKLYKQPETIEVLETTLDLTEVLELIKQEIHEIDAIIEPAQRMVLKDNETIVDDDLIAKYQNLGSE